MGGTRAGRAVRRAPGGGPPRNRPLTAPVPARADWAAAARQFGKQIQKQALPEWAAHYMNYKALKKIIKAQEARRAAARSRPSAVSAAAPAAGSASRDDERPFLTQVDHEVEKVRPRRRGSCATCSLSAQADRARRLGAVNTTGLTGQVEAFYNQREQELKARLAVLTVRGRVCPGQGRGAPQRLTFRPGERFGLGPTARATRCQEKKTAMLGKPRRRADVMQTFREAFLTFLEEVTKLQVSECSRTRPPAPSADVRTWAWLVRRGRLCRGRRRTLPSSTTRPSAKSSKSTTDASPRRSRKSTSPATRMSSPLRTSPSSPSSRTRLRHTWPNWTRCCGTSAKYVVADCSRPHRIVLLGNAAESASAAGGRGLARSPPAGQGWV